MKTTNLFMQIKTRQEASARDALVYALTRLKHAASETYLELEMVSPDSDNLELLQNAIMGAEEALEVIAEM